MGKTTTGYNLYEHREDPSVLYLVRRLVSEDGTVAYEMSRYRPGQANDPPFVLDAAAFEPVYRRTRTHGKPNPETTERSA